MEYFYLVSLLLLNLSTYCDLIHVHQLIYIHMSPINPLSVSRSCFRRDSTILYSIYRHYST